MRSFLTCAVCLLMMGSQYVWALGEGSNIQLVRGPQKLRFEAAGAVWPKLLLKV